MFVRFELTSGQGTRGLTIERAAQLAGTNPDHATQDLVEAIERGEYPTWTLNIQVMTEEQSEKVDFNPFNVTKIWPKDQFPLVEVGRLLFNRNTENHFDESEQSVFNPGNFVPGIRAAEGDKNLAGRIFVYQDTQIYRAGVNRMQLPINRPLQPVANYMREGRGVYVSQGAAPVYFPNSFGGPVESVRAAELDPSYKACGLIDRYDESDEDHFAHPRLFLKSLTPDHRDRMISVLGSSLRPIRKDIVRRVLENYRKVDQDFAEKVEEAIEQSPDDFMVVQ